MTERGHLLPTFLEDCGIRCVERENAKVAEILLFCHDLNNEVY